MQLPPKARIPSGGPGDQGQMRWREAEDQRDLALEHALLGRNRLLKDAGKDLSLGRTDAKARTMLKPAADTPVLSLEEARKIQASRKFTHPAKFSLQQEGMAGDRRESEGTRGVLTKAQILNLTQFSGKSEAPLSAWSSEKSGLGTNTPESMLPSRESSQKSGLGMNTPEMMLPAGGSASKQLFFGMRTNDRALPSRESAEKSRPGLSTPESMLPAREAASKQSGLGLNTAEHSPSVLPAIDVMFGAPTSAFITAQTLGSPKPWSFAPPNEQARRPQYVYHSPDTPNRAATRKPISISGQQTFMGRPNSRQSLCPEQLTHTLEANSHALLGSGGKEESQERMIAEDASDSEFDSEDDSDHDEYQLDEELPMMRHAERDLMKSELRPANASGSASGSRWKAFRALSLGQNALRKGASTPEGADTPEPEDLQSVDRFQLMYTPPPYAKTKRPQLESNMASPSLHMPSPYSRSKSPQLDFGSAKIMAMWNDKSYLTSLLRSDEYPWDRMVSVHRIEAPRPDKLLVPGHAQLWDNNQSELRFKYRERLDALSAVEGGPMNNCRRQVSVPSGKVQYGLMPKKCLSPDPQLYKQKSSSRH
ncbi:hypothetical protein CYMTET_32858 [Cymbomonas tetramitiformis]|uniref:Uncharacterized protein n=1 Tax=Cymbomonas tetramitiformis TaxID=36881 RepID=A0AAE0FE86_9CHLO|nr:hypothetical protein CYMTET_32858 [Cymbomonas tetramitiformis]